MHMTLTECMTLTDILPTTIFSVKLMHLCIKEIIAIFLNWPEVW